VEALDAKLDHLHPDAVYVGFDQIANLIGDGHTYVDVPSDRANLPLSVTRFGAEERIDAVAPGYERALGARVVAVGDTPLTMVDDLLATATPVAETEGLRDLRVDYFLSIGLMLHGFGITGKRCRHLRARWRRREAVPRRVQGAFARYIAEVGLCGVPTSAGGTTRGQQRAVHLSQAGAHAVLQYQDDPSAGEAFAADAGVDASGASR